jgi:hypothetical protein
MKEGPSMSLHQVFARVVFRSTLFAVIAFAGAGAQAMTVNYQCVGYRPLSAELTPREGQIHFEGQDWTVTRVPGAHDARYVNSRAGISAMTRQREMTFTHGGETLKCFLKSDALESDHPASTPVR